MCRGKVDQWTGGQDTTGAPLVSSGQSELLYSPHLALASHLSLSTLCQHNNAKLDNIQIYAVIQ